MSKSNPLNPIDSFLRDLKEYQDLSYEDIAKLCKIRYETFMNIFKRPKVSDSTLDLLMKNEIINKTVLTKYRNWYADYKASKLQK